MKRRIFLKILGAAIGSQLLPGAVNALAAQLTRQANDLDPHIKDYLHKMRFFDRAHPADIYLQGHDLQLLRATVRKFKLIQSTIGHGHFHLLNFDEALKTAAAYHEIGAFSPAELNFLEKIFYRDASQYGFTGSKPNLNLTDSIRRARVVKEPVSRHYLYKNKALETFRKIKHDLGDQVVLTSGIRGIVKQFLLFLGKTAQHQGNLSLASRTLAPPGYSFHGAGDFDVGQADLGWMNFTERFTSTAVYRNLVELGYANLRYEQGNMLGVRFEPWHIKLG